MSDPIKDVPVNLRADAQWKKLLTEILRDGAVVAPDNPGGVTLEILANKTLVDMRWPVVTEPARRLGYRFMAAESACVLSGDNRVSSLAPYSKFIVSTSDDGITFRGSYGTKFVEQAGWVADELVRDPSSRRAVMTLWRERPGPSRDYPCTVSIQWLYRNRRLHCVTTMRSSDAWLGWPYDVHTFSVMSAAVLLTAKSIGLRKGSKEFVSADLGVLQLTSGSQHLYERDFEGARKCLSANPSEPVYAPLSPEEFATVDELIDHMWAVARRTPTPKRWLTEFIPREDFNVGVGARMEGMLPPTGSVANAGRPE